MFPSEKRKHQKWSINTSQFCPLTVFKIFQDFIKWPANSRFVGAGNINVVYSKYKWFPCHYSVYMMK